MMIGQKKSDPNVHVPRVYDHTKAFIVGIAGGTASGKTTLSNKIAKEFKGNIVSFSFDSFYKDFEVGQDPAQYDFDHPNAYDFEEAYKCLHALKNKEDTEIPVYSFIENARLPGQTKIIKAKNIVIVEGILAFYDFRIRNLMDFKIFVHCDPDIALCRRLKRDILERGRVYQEVLMRYNKFVKNDFEDYVKPFMKSADMIIPGGAKNHIGVQFILDNLRVQEKRMEEFSLKDDTSSKKLEDLLQYEKYNLIKSEYSTNLNFSFNIASHETRLLKGLFQTFDEDYLNLTFHFLWRKLEKRVKSILEADFKESWDLLKGSTIFSNSKNILKSREDSVEKFRVHVITDLFFFKEDLAFDFDKLPSSLSRSIREPKYLVCLFTDHATLKSYLSLLPIFKLIPMFVVKDKGTLMNVLSGNYKDEKKLETVLSDISIKF